MDHNDDMKSTLQTMLGWLLVALLAYGAIAIKWDEWGAKAVIERVHSWRGWKRLRRWTAERLRSLARALDGRGARQRNTIFTGEIPREPRRRPGRSLAPPPPLPPPPRVPPPPVKSTPPPEPEQPETAAERRQRRRRAAQRRLMGGAEKTFDDLLESGQAQRRR